ncbi:sensor histidine kinase [Vibrio ponticus]|nr:sensor histidine kinase [Vibrio ponticus]
MPLKAKLILLSLLPLLLVTISTSWISVYQAQTLRDKEVEIFRSSLIKSKETALRDSVDLALDSIRHVYNDPSLDERVAKAQVKAIIEKLRYGTDGYFFVYDQEGTNLVHPIMPELQGQNLLDIQDNNGDFLIVTLLEQAQRGGGFHQYLWKKPSTGETVTKLSYAAWWINGSGWWALGFILKMLAKKSPTSKVRWTKISKRPSFR